MKTCVHNFTSQQVHLNEFDNSTDLLTIPDSLITATREPDFIPSPDYSCSCRHGYGLTSDYFNPWKLQEETEDCSRGDLARAYRIQRVQKGGF